MSFSKILTSATFVCAITFLPATSVAENEDLTARVEALEKRFDALEKSLQPLIQKATQQQSLASQKQQARIRMRKDAENYSRDQLREIETLYQVANKKWGTAEAQKSLEKLVNKYDKANRTGCAILYLGQMSKGEEQIKHLQQAIDQFEDCFYGNGVQVGAYARYQLAQVYLADKKSDQAQKLINEIREKFPQSIDHRGNLLVAMLPK